MSRRSKRQKSYTPPVPDMKRIFPKTDAQELMMNSIDDNHVTFVDGCAGVGKTLIAVYKAVSLIENHEIDDILYIKPNVDMTGERGVGFLKGELDEKLAPLLDPLKDNIKVFLAEHKTKYYENKDKISVGLLEYLRGRSLDRTFVIFDEAQNTTPHGVITAISRLTDNSKIVVMGDVVQCDTGLHMNGLRDAFLRYKGLPDIGFVQFTEDDVVRNGFMRGILRRYRQSLPAS